MEVGERVRQGHVLMILESMKMEIPVEAPADGSVVEIRVRPEDQVDEGQVVAILDV